jgi:hypothetical protein
MKYLCDIDDPRSCLCCGKMIIKARRPKKMTKERFYEGLERVTMFGYSKEDLLGPYLKHLDWQFPGVSDLIRKSLS